MLLYHVPSSRSTFSPTCRSQADRYCENSHTICEVNLGQLIDPERSVAEGGVLTWTASQSEHYGWVLQNAGQYHGFPFDLNAPIKTLGPVQRDLLLHGTYGPQFRRHFPDV
jgi:excinuclease ABC subunit A